MTQNNFKNEAIIGSLALSLACQYLASITDKDAGYWGIYFGKKAVELLEDNSITKEEVERIVANALNNGKLIRN